jgi:hypothetical protein
MRDTAAEGLGWADAPPPNGKLVSLDAPHQADAAAVGPDLTLSGSQVLLDGKPAADASRPAEAATQIQDAQRARAEFWAQTNPRRAHWEETAIVVKLAQTDAWSDIATALDACARAGYRKATFVFDLRSKVPPPLETPVSRELEKTSREAMSGESVDPSRKARTPAEERSEPSPIFARCPRVVDLVFALGGRAVSSDEKFSYLATQIPDGIEQCSCKVDFDEVKAGYWFMLGRYGGSPRAGYTLTLAARGEPGAAEIAAPRTDTWSNVYPRVLAASTQHVSFLAL